MRAIIRALFGSFVVSEVPSGFVSQLFMALISSVTDYSDTDISTGLVDKVAE